MRLSFSSNKPRNFCYVVFESSQSAVTVVNTPEHILDGLPILCEMCKPNKKNTERFKQRFEDSSFGLQLDQAQHLHGADDLSSLSQGLNTTHEFVTRTGKMYGESLHDLCHPFTRNHKNEESSYRNFVLKDQNCSGEGIFNPNFLRIQKHKGGVVGPTQPETLAVNQSSQAISHRGLANQSSVCGFSLMNWKPTSLHYSRTARAQINDRHDASDGLLLFTIAWPRPL